MTQGAEHLPDDRGLLRGGLQVAAGARAGGAAPTRRAVGIDRGRHGGIVLAERRPAFVDFISSRMDPSRRA